MVGVIDALHRLAQRRVRRYLLHALALMQDRALHSDAVDWPAVAVAFRDRPGVRTFGTATAGLTSANQPHVLRDGSRMYLTVAYFADHRRTVYRGPLPVDDPCGDPFTAAVDWVRQTA